VAGKKVNGRGNKYLRSSHNVFSKGADVRQTLQPEPALIVQNVSPERKISSGLDKDTVSPKQAFHHNSEYLFLGLDKNGLKGMQELDDKIQQQVNVEMQT